MMELLLIAFIVANVLDAYLTRRIIKNGGRELNPVYALLFDKLGFNGAMAVLKIVTLLLFVWLLNHGYWWPAVGLTAFSWAVVAWNARQLKKQN